ncbi:hypothetical protein AVEN_218938-1 [Araneus ventricosus]|uniref:Uncharacterized protein n=1 Tax=Araneus ventricosus TaxID=182803 RepID=A0A4Y2H2D7_ARAVE|nr:hypothetical protein AVEN_218938-1 [Araneus ventricosus]
MKFGCGFVNKRENLCQGDSLLGHRFFGQSFANTPLQANAVEGSPCHSILLPHPFRQIIYDRSTQSKSIHYSHPDPILSPSPLSSVNNPTQAFLLPLRTNSRSFYGQAVQIERWI